MADNRMDGYVEVKDRIVEFRDKYPEGSLQPVNLEEPFKLECMEDGKTYLVYAAAAYRTAHDPRPGIGCAWEEYPGKTNFTRGSELQNAETSAWGRAIIAALAADAHTGIASAEEVRNRRAEQEGDDGRTHGAGDRKLRPGEAGELRKDGATYGYAPAAIALLAKELGYTVFDGDRADFCLLTTSEAAAVRKHMEENPKAGS